MMDATRKNGNTKSTHKNPILVPGNHRFGRATMYHKKGIWAKRNINNSIVVRQPSIIQAMRKEKVVVEKKIGGDKNGGTRLVQLKKSRRYHPTAVARNRKIVKRTGVNPKTKLRGSLVPGTILILVDGRHAGKRVVLLKQLTSGLLLVTGPFKVNGVSLRRVNQRYVIATSTRLDISKVKIPDAWNDSYFGRNKKEARKIREQRHGDIFAVLKITYFPSEQRKKDQAEADKLSMPVLKAHPEKKTLLKYLGSSFYLRTGQYPHRMKF